MQKQPTRSKPNKMAAETKDKASSVDHALPLPATSNAPLSKTQNFVHGLKGPLTCVLLYHSSAT